MSDKKGKFQCPDTNGPCFIGTSRVMHKVHEKIMRVASSDIPIFITGSTGTGKEVCAESVHFYSRRHDKPFVALNSATLPPNMIDSALFGHVKRAFTGAENSRDGAIARAEGGTLFLDEICEMPLESQAKLLRFTQKLEYQKLGSDTVQKANVRLICASNKNPYEQVKAQRFREDLYYRLFIAPIHMPLLQDRGGDIIDIAAIFLERFNQQYGKNFEDFNTAVTNLFLTHDWPGNVRELENVIHEVVSSYDGPFVTTGMIPSHIGKIQTKKEKLEQIDAMSGMSLPLWRIEKRAIEAVLHQTQNNVQKAAEILDVAPSTIYRKMKSWKSFSG